MAQKLAKTTVKAFMMRLIKLHDQEDDGNAVLKYCITVPMTGRHAREVIDVMVQWCSMPGTDEADDLRMSWVASPS